MFKLEEGGIEAFKNPKIASEAMCYLSQDGIA
jgi:hypothetical protein